MPNVQSAEAAILAATKLLDALGGTLELGEVTVDVAGSIGVAVFPEDGEDPDTLLQRADVAMYLVKEAHSGEELYTHERDVYSPGRLALVTELRRAIDGDELVLFYQPKADLLSGHIVGVEALVRWYHPRRGRLAPDEFISIAEHTGLIRPLTHSVLNRALEQCRAWELAGTPLKVAVNLSLRSLLDSRLPEDIEGMLRRWRVAPASLQLEITESCIMADPVRTLAILARISDMGIGLSIDDFGTGYSSLSHLKRMPVDEIKIDRSFVIGMAADENDSVIVRSTIELGRNLGLRVVAEGVETADAWDQLVVLGCDVAQGYYLSRPLPARKLTRWMQDYCAGLPEPAPTGGPETADESEPPWAVRLRLA